jgi:hypothetical protein
MDRRLLFHPELVLVQRLFRTVTGFGIFTGRFVHAQGAGFVAHEERGHFPFG